MASRFNRTSTAALLASITILGTSGVAGATGLASNTEAPAVESSAPADSEENNQGGQHGTQPTPSVTPSTPAEPTQSASAAPSETPSATPSATPSETPSTGLRGAMNDSNPLRATGPIVWNIPSVHR